MTDTLRLEVVSRAGSTVRVRVSVLQPTDLAATRSFALAILQELHPNDLGVDWHWARDPSACVQEAVRPGTVEAVRVAALAFGSKRPPREPTMELEIELGRERADWLAAMAVGTRRDTALFAMRLRRDDTTLPDAGSCLASLRDLRGKALTAHDRDQLRRWALHPKDHVVAHVLELAATLPEPGFLQPEVVELTQDGSNLVRLRAIHWLRVVGDEAAGHALAALLIADDLRHPALLAAGGLKVAPAGLVRSVEQLVPTLTRWAATARWVVWRHRRDAKALDAWLRAAFETAEFDALRAAPHALDETIAAVVDWIAGHPDVVNKSRSGRAALLREAGHAGGLRQIKQAIAGGTAAKQPTAGKMPAAKKPATNKPAAKKPAAKKLAAKKQR
jgi:hypothetical protein